MLSSSEDAVTILAAPLYLLNQASIPFAQVELYSMQAHPHSAIQTNITTAPINCNERCIFLVKPTEKWAISEECCNVCHKFLYGPGRPYYIIKLHHHVASKHQATKSNRLQRE